MSEIELINGAVDVAIKGEKLGMIGLLLLACLSLFGALVYFARAIKAPIEALKQAICNTNETTTKLTGILHEQNTKTLLEIKEDLQEMLICCREMRSSQNGDELRRLVQRLADEVDRLKGVRV